MAICTYCNQEMSSDDTESCTMETVKFPDGEELPVALFHFDEEDGRCHDCHIVHGGVHHPGCDVERCPRCHGQLIGCGCLDEDDEQGSD